MRTRTPIDVLLKHLGTGATGVLSVDLPDASVRVHVAQGEIVAATTDRDAADVLHRLVDVWATGEAGAALGFETARLFDRLDPLDREKDRLFAEQGISGRGVMKAFAKIQQDGTECIALRSQPEETSDNGRLTLARGFRPVSRAANSRR